MTKDELMKVYEDAGLMHKYKLCSRHPDAEIMTVADMKACHDAAILAVYLKGFQDGAERQRAVEPTEEMEIEAVKSGCNKIDAYCAYRAMSAVAPLVVPEK